MERLVPERPSHLLRVADLPTRKATEFSFDYEETARTRVAETLGILAVKKLRFTGKIEASGGTDWHLRAELGATVVQPCVVTLDPVTTRIDEPVERRYLAHMPEIEGSEVEMADDETIDEIPVEIDLEALMLEALSLSLPQFPRKNDAELGTAVFTEAGKDPMTDDDAKPFAGLGALKSALENKGD